MKAAVANFRPTGENLVGMEQVLRSYEVSEKPLRRYAIPTPFPIESYW